MSSSLWQLGAEKSGQGSRTNSVITCSRTLTLFLCGYLKDKVFNSAPRTLPELKEKVKENCAQVTRGKLTRVVQKFLLCLQEVREFQGAHIEHVIHNATHMWISNPSLLLWHCFHINKFPIANALLSWKWQQLTETNCISFLNFIFPMCDTKRISKIVFASHKWSWTVLWRHRFIRHLV